MGPTRSIGNQTWRVYLGSTSFQSDDHAVRKGKISRRMHRKFIKKNPRINRETDLPTCFGREVCNDHLVNGTSWGIAAMAVRGVWIARTVATSKLNCETIAFEITTVCCVEY